MMPSKFGKIATDVQSRLNALEKSEFGETVQEAIDRLKNNDNNRFNKECDAMQGTTIYRMPVCIGGIGFQCSRCGLTLKFNSAGKFEAHGVSDEQLIRLGQAPLEDRCDHKEPPTKSKLVIGQITD